MDDGNSVNPLGCGLAACPSIRSWLILWLCLPLAVWGCGRRESGKPEASGESSSSTPANDDPDSRSVAKTSGSSGRNADKKESGRRYVGDIPLDVWFDDPLTVAGNSTPAGGNVVPAGSSVPSKGNSPAPPTQTTPTKSPAETVSPPPATGTAPVAAGDWKSLISGELIADETKAIKARINTALSTVSKYNGNYKDIQVEASVLAALAEIAATHPDNIGWKKDAAHVRDLAVDVGKQAKGLAQPNYDNTRKAFERLDGLLSGNRPPDLGKAEAKRPFHDVAPRGPVMRRMDISFQWLKANVNTAALLKSSAEKVDHEATILATLSQVVGTEGYTSADEAEYQKFLRDLIQSSRKASAAAKEGDFAAFTEAISQCQKKCNECHQNFRFSDG